MTRTTPFKPTRAAASALVLMLVLVTCSLQFAGAQDLMDIFSAFVDVDGALNETYSIFDLAREAFAEEKLAAKDANHSFAPVDDAYLLAPVDHQALLQLHAACKTAQSQALQTWCTGNATFVDEDDKLNPESVLCPQSVRTHPCTGRVLNAEAAGDAFEFLWPWEGVRCNAYTDPTTVTHMCECCECFTCSSSATTERQWTRVRLYVCMSSFLPDEHLRCQLSDVDLSVMVSLEQLYGDLLSTRAGITCCKRAVRSVAALVGRHASASLRQLVEQPPERRDSNLVCGRQCPRSRVRASFVEACVVGLVRERADVAYLEFLPSDARAAFPVSLRRFYGTAAASRFRSPHRAGGVRKRASAHCVRLLGRVRVMTTAAAAVGHEASVVFALRSNVSHNRFFGSFPVLPRPPKHIVAMYTPAVVLYGEDTIHIINHYSTSVTRMLAQRPLVQQPHWRAAGRSRVVRTRRSARSGRSVQSPSLVRAPAAVACSARCSVVTQQLTGEGSRCRVQRRIFQLVRRPPSQHLAPDVSATIVSLSVSLHDRSAHSFVGNQFECPVADFLARTNLECQCPHVNNASAPSSSEHETVKTAADGCSYCVSGFSSSASTNHECRACPAGTSSSSSAMSSRSRPRHHNSSDDGDGPCFLCAPGTFANESRMETCLECPEGTYASGAGMTKCERCLPGFFANSVGRSECTPCDAGFFSGSHGLAACAPCPPGSYSAVRGEAECLPCPIGSFQDSAGQTSCTPCAEGYVAPFPGHSACSACPPGSVFDRASKMCRRCPPNTFAGSSAQTQCVRCPAGMAADGVGNVECFAKPPLGFERLVPSSSMNASQTECRPGFFNDGQRLSCEPCPPGTFAATHGAHTCSPCARGSFVGRKGATSCELAPPGTFTAQEGGWKPRRCPPNFVSSSAGSVGCTKCPWLTFSPLGGGSRCESARAGEINDFVVWPRLTMTIAGVSSRDLSEKTAAGVSLDSLSTSWKAAFAAYGVKNVKLHLMTVEPQTPDDDLLFVEFALETLPLPLPKRQKRNSTLFEKFRDKTSEFKRFIGSTRANVEQEEVGHVVEKNRRANGNESNSTNESDSSGVLQELVARPGFLEALVRQLHRQGVADVSAGVVQIALLTESPLRTPRALPCPNGTYFAHESGASDDDQRECRLCPTGTFSNAPGALQCTLCPAGTFADEEGLEECVKCPVGDGSYPGATSCVECYWFTYECEGFWEDVLLALVVGIWGGARIWMRCHRALSGDTLLQQQNEQTALIAAVRANGRTGRSALYEPMVRDALVRLL
ncbi:hypothetical protein PybrP1_008293 [[Pythium] brassicae (nom. inval.)]|nr:hypothetical protein PybrP1_008293 [[Pythium] brassicae (nom. inval.)]